MYCLANSNYFIFTESSFACVQGLILRAIPNSTILIAIFLKEKVQIEITPERTDDDLFAFRTL